MNDGRPIRGLISGPETDTGPLHSHSLPWIVDVGRVPVPLWTITRHPMVNFPSSRCQNWTSKSDHSTYSEREGESRHAPTFRCHRDSSAGIWSDETAYWRGMTYSPSSSEGGGDSRRADAVHERASKPEPRESRLSPSAGSRDDARIAASWYSGASTYRAANAYPAPARPIDTVSAGYPASRQSEYDIRHTSRRRSHASGQRIAQVSTHPRTLWPARRREFLMRPGGILMLATAIASTLALGWLAIFLGQS